MRTLIELRQEILNECTDYIVHLMTDMRHLDNDATNPVNPDRIAEFARGSDNNSETDRFPRYGILKPFLAARIPDKYLSSDGSWQPISSLSSELSELNDKVGGCYSGTLDDVRKLSGNKRYVGALKKLSIMNDLLLTLPSVAEVNADGKKAFQDFHAKFKEAHKDLQEIRRNDSLADRYLVPFVKAITGFLLCCTVVLSPLAYYGLYRTPGVNMTGRLENMLDEQQITLSV